ncbi:MAG TPA: Gfo/Idh/MocA family oxidoreductase [Burkholderiales bacterium]
MKRVRVAGVGAGYFSQFHLQGWRALPEVELVGWCDMDVSKVKGLPAFRSMGELLDKAKPDLIDIVTPPETHLEIVRAVAERKLPMICQKPLAPTYAEAVAVVDAGGKLVVHENFRWQPWYREARRLVDSDHFGKLHSVAFRLRPGDGQGPRAYLDRQPYFQRMPRLLVHETAIHWIDTFRFLMGEVSAVSAMLRRMNPVLAGEDAGYLVFEFASGATGLFDGNRLNDHVASNPRRTMGEMWLEGEKGVLRLDGEARLWWKPHQQPETEHRYDRGPDDAFGGGCCYALQRHVVRHFLEGAALENQGMDYLVNLRIEEAVYRSSAEGRKVTLQ